MGIMERFIRICFYLAVCCHILLLLVNFLFLTNKFQLLINFKFL